MTLPVFFQSRSFQRLTEWRQHDFSLSFYVNWLQGTPVCIKATSLDPVGMVASSTSLHWNFGTTFLRDAPLLQEWSSPTRWTRCSTTTPSTPSSTRHRRASTSPGPSSWTSSPRWSVSRQRFLGRSVIYSLGLDENLYQSIAPDTDHLKHFFFKYLSLFVWVSSLT